MIDKIAKPPLKLIDEVSFVKMFERPELSYL